MGQGKPEALTHCLAGVWGRLHDVVVVATVSVYVNACTHVTERVGRRKKKRHGGGEWLPAEGGGGGWKMERAAARGEGELRK